MSEEQGEGADRHRLKTTFASKIRKGAGEKGKHVGGTVCRGNEITGMLQRDGVVGQHAVIMGGTAVEKQCAKRQAKRFANNAKNGIRDAATSRGAQGTHGSTNRTKSRRCIRYKHRRTLRFWMETLWAISAE